MVIINYLRRGEMKTALSISALAIGLVLVFSLPVSAGDKPSFDFSFYGKVKLDGAYDQNLTSHDNFVIWVKPQEYGEDDEQSNMTANETRLGLAIDGKNFDHFKVNCKMGVGL
jgi:hypothetical protein